MPIKQNELKEYFSEDSKKLVTLKKDVIDEALGNSQEEKIKNG